MLKMFSVLTDTPSQSLLLLIYLTDSSINDAVINVAPFINSRSFKWSMLRIRQRYRLALAKCPRSLKLIHILFVPLSFFNSEYFNLNPVFFWQHYVYQQSLTIMHVVSAARQPVSK